MALKLRSSRRAFWALRWSSGCWNRACRVKGADRLMEVKIPHIHCLFFTASLVASEATMDSLRTSFLKTIAKAEGMRYCASSSVTACPKMRAHITSREIVPTGRIFYPLFLHAWQVPNIVIKGALAVPYGGVLALMDWLGISDVASPMRHFCAHAEESLQLLCGRLERQYG